MIYFLFVLILLLSAFVLIWPYLRGYNDIVFNDEAGKKAESTSDQIESIKLALRDLDLESKIGKISQDDFHSLKDELLEEWQEAEKKK